MSEQSQPSRITIQQRIGSLRERHPDLRVETDLAALEADLVVFKALVAAGGASATAHIAVAIARPDVRQATIERAEEEAIGRALDRLGFAAPASAQPRRETAPTPTPRTAPATPPARTAESESKPAPTPVVSEPAISEPVAARPTAAQADEPDMADFSWTAFWVWAKAQSISTRGQVVEILGHSVDNLTPGAIRRELVEKGYRGEG